MRFESASCQPGLYWRQRSYDRVVVDEGVLSWLGGAVVHHEGQHGRLFAAGKRIVLQMLLLQELALLVHAVDQVLVADQSLVRLPGLLLVNAVGKHKLRHTLCKV